MRVVVIGAGIGGLAAGVALRASGADVVVYERAEENLPVGSGIAIGRNALDGLDELGAGEAVRALVSTSSRRDVRKWDGTLMTSGPFGGGAIRRSDLHRALLDRIPDAVQFDRTFRNFEQDRKRVIVRFEDGGEEEADMLVGADGLRSRVREQLVPEARPLFRGVTAWRGIAQIEHELFDDAITETWGRGRRVGLQPMVPPFVYWWMAAVAAEGSVTPDSRDLLLKMFHGWHAPIEDVIHATVTPIVQSDLYDLDPLPRWDFGRVSLLGDSAHAMTPDLGQGSAQAILDALVLGEAVRAAPHDVGAALATYDRRRRRDAYAIMRRARRHLQVAHVRNPVAVAVRNVVVRRLPGAAQTAIGIRRPSSITGGERRVSSG
jgi:2-polyprenyl-6-methoxyphenol hydroxylase-like FAD-dependent oxidoreductase